MDVVSQAGKELSLKTGDARKPWGEKTLSPSREVRPVIGICGLPVFPLYFLFYFEGIMPRYAKQRDKYCCGPVAILNALKWSGQNVAYEKNIRALKALTGQTPKHGTSNTNLYRALRVIGGKIFQSMRIRPRLRPTLPEIEEHVRKGGAVLLQYNWIDKNGSQSPEKWNFSGHYILITEVSPSGHRFEVINGYTSTPAARRIGREKFKRDMLGFQRGNPGVRGWFLTRLP